MARAHREQHALIQVVLHREHPLFRFLEQERQHLGQSRAGYFRWLLEQQFLHTRGGRKPPAPRLEAAALTADGNLAAIDDSQQSTLEPDDDLLANFVS